MKPEVSIIVPVYNAEMYLSRCIESIIGQTYKNIELILIDDGSADRSGNICDEFAHRDNRIIVVHKRNAGVSAARNDGIKLSRGRYLQFVDSDDYIDGKMTAILIDRALRNDSDIVICGFNTIDYKTGELMPFAYSQTDLNLDVKEFLAIYYDLYLTRYLNTPCNKLYEAGLVKDNEIYFEPDIDYGEDLIFNLEVFKRCSKFSIINSCLYNYALYHNNDSLTRKPRADMYEIQKMMFEEVVALYVDADGFSEEIKSLEQGYTRDLIKGVIQYYASYTILKDYKSFEEKARTVWNDEVLQKCIINYQPNSAQERILVFFLQNNMYFSLYVYVQIKEVFRNRFPRIFGYLRKKGGGQ